MIFQSTLPRGERQRWGIIRNAPANFNPRSHEGSDQCRLLPCYTSCDFNPRSHEGSDVIEFRHIHKSTDFNPRSHEGSDGVIRELTALRIHFNPRSHEGSDVLTGRIGCGMTISIHAPTRGATAIFAKKFSFLSAKIV